MIGPARLRDGPAASHGEPRAGVKARVRGLGRPGTTAIRRRLEGLLIDDEELLIALQCQLEELRRPQGEPEAGRG